MWKDCPRVYEPETPVTITKKQFYDAFARLLREWMTERNFSYAGGQDRMLEAFSGTLGKFAHEIGLHSKPEILP